MPDRRPRTRERSDHADVDVTGNTKQLDDLVEDDVFRASVTVLRKIDYDTQIGGNTTVPLLEVACDTINNLSTNALFELGDAAAHATLTLALSSRVCSPTAAVRLRSR